MKTCTKCKEVKTVDCFSKQTARKDGLQARCKKCCKKLGAKYRLDNPEKELQRSARYRLDNAESAKESQKKYRESNPEKRRCAVSKWEKNNKAKILITKQKYRESNPEKFRDYCNSRRAKKLSNGVFKIATKELKKLYESPCLYCGSIESIQADHVVPIARGGTHSIGNLVPACARCNQSKGSKLLTEWKASLKWAI